MRYGPKRRFIWIPFFVLLSASLLSAAVMWLWNHVLVEVVQVRPVTFWQAAGLMLLSRLLFGNWPGRGRPGWGQGTRSAWKAKWQQMSDEEKARFREQWRKRI
ncbi:hypothetical protein [Fibrivirga algicola]|uniref:Uncharacterized protein n=1 Tax=Fibrivirga algicola TaxID=2950420 RepID=A0ABX0QQ95_9BACT|nr:hypothetical protein [Fibrivirga algicola]ARK11789.1 hypothetical protein A6C57_16430 [Fibrella sp. ES10-3-2-2]NID13320.1 hypothetical protein [Fibrivirga algicola]